MWWHLFLLWAICEALFYSWVELTYRKSVDKVRNPGRFHLNTEKTLKHMTRMCTIIKRVSSLEEFTRGFFCGASVSSLGQDNVLSFITWAFTGLDYFMLKKNATSSQDLEKVDMVKECYKLLCQFFPEEMVTIKPGYNRNVRHISMNLDPVHFYHKPFIFYLVLRIFNFAYELIVMRILGGWKSSHVKIAPIHVNKSRGKSDFKLRYWYNPGGVDKKGANGKAQPLLFLHGISYGWIIYSGLLSMWSDRPVLMIDLETISIGTFSRYHPSAPALAQAIKKILLNHGYEKADICGHSFGTMLATTVVNYAPEIIGTNLVLIDPVCLLLTLPDVAYNFLYKPPATLFDWVIALGASREATIARTLYRDFVWFEYDMILEKVPEESSIIAVLGGRDELLNPVSIHKYLTIFESEEGKERKGTLKKMLLEDKTHGEVLFSGSTLMQIQEAIDDAHRVRKEALVGADL